MCNYLTKSYKLLVLFIGNLCSTLIACKSSTAMTLCNIVLTINITAKMIVQTVIMLLLAQALKPAFVFGNEIETQTQISNEESIREFLRDLELGLITNIQFEEIDYDDIDPDQLPVLDFSIYVNEDGSLEILHGTDTYTYVCDPIPEANGVALIDDVRMIAVP